MDEKQTKRPPAERARVSHESEAQNRAGQENAQLSSHSDKEVCIVMSRLQSAEAGYLVQYQQPINQR